MGSFKCCYLGIIESLTNNLAASKQPTLFLLIFTQQHALAFPSPLPLPHFCARQARNLSWAGPVMEKNCTPSSPTFLVDSRSQCRVSNLEQRIHRTYGPLLVAVRIWQLASTHPAAPCAAFGARLFPLTRVQFVAHRFLEKDDCFLMNVFFCFRYLQHTIYGLGVDNIDW